MGLVRFRRYPLRTCLTLVVSVSPGLIADGTAADTPVQATHIMGLENIPKGANGHLSIQAGAFQFQQDYRPGAQITISSIQSVFSGEQDRQVGGVPMALGQAATPFGGGRVIGLFSHKKYDTLTVQYVDANGGLHGAVFQLSKGQGQALRNKLQAEGAQVTPPEGNAK
jgi:hypothetical protein